MNGHEEYKELTGFKAKGAARYRILIKSWDIWCEHKGAQTLEKAKTEARKLPGYTIKIIDLEA